MHGAPRRVRQNPAKMSAAKKMGQAVSAGINSSRARRISDPICTTASLWFLCAAAITAASVSRLNVGRGLMRPVSLHPPYTSP